MKIKIMKKFYLVLWVLGIFVGFLSSCDDDKYKPGVPELEIVSVYCCKGRYLVSESKVE